MANVAHTRTVQVEVEIWNRGREEDTRDVELERIDGEAVDTTEVTLGPDETTQVALTDSDFGTPAIQTTINYQIQTGDRRPEFEAFIVGVFEVTQGENVPAGFDVGRIEWENEGELHLENDGDELRLHNT